MFASADGEPADSHERVPVPEPDLIVAGPLTIVPDQLLVSCGGAELWLRPREMALLALLAAHAGQLLSRELIFSEVWGGQLRAGDRSVDVHVARLRVKLADLAPGWECIHTHHGHGYRFEPRACRRRS